MAQREQRGQAVFSVRNFVGIVRKITWFPLITVTIYRQYHKTDCESAMSVQQTHRESYDELLIDFQLSLRVKFLGEGQVDARDLWLKFIHWGVGMVIEFTRIMQVQKIYE